MGDLARMWGLLRWFQVEFLKSRFQRNRRESQVDLRKEAQEYNEGFWSAYTLKIDM